MSAPASTLRSPSPGRAVDPQRAVPALEQSPRLARRRFGWLPHTGPGAPHTTGAGRGPGAATTTESLGELISSIASDGVLTPLLVEELGDPAGGTALRVVCGQRRLRACRIGAREAPDNPHFAQLPAMICPGPLTEEDLTRWRLIENLARTDYQPGELAAELLAERCAVLAARLRDATVTLPETALTETDDPVARWQLLERARSRHAPGIGAPWELVLARLGVAFGPRKARALVAAFTTLPRELSADLDAHRIALATRTDLVRLARDPAQSVTELWGAVKALDRPELLAAASAAATDPAMGPQQAAAAAAALHETANAARAAKLTGQPTGPPDHRADTTAGRNSEDAGPEEGHGPPVDEQITRAALAALRELTAALRGGARVPGYAAGSLRLLATELTTTLGAAGPRRAAAGGPAR